MSSLVIVLLGLFVLLFVILFFFTSGKQSLFGKFISNYYPQTTVNYSVCSEDSDCVIGIRLGGCCSCPQAVNKNEIGKGWELYISGKAYQRSRGCTELCEQCAEVSEVLCSDNRCVVKGIFDEIASLSTEFRKLRKIKGHFEGGEWNDDVDSYGGRKHQVMIALLREIRSIDKDQLVHFLGVPDGIIRGDDDLTKSYSISADDNSEILVYYWRGEHDFMYFITSGDLIIKSGWWYAGE